MKKGILLAVVILLSAVSFAQAAEGELGVTYDVTFLSRYIWRGQDLYGPNVSALQQKINIDVFGSGFGVGIKSVRANTGGFENAEELDVSLYYGGTCNEGATRTDYVVGWMYYNYPDEPRGGNVAAISGRTGAGDMQEFFATLSWPEICPTGVVPSVTLISMFPSQHGSNASANRGFYCDLGLDYAMTVSGLLPDTAEQVLDLSLDLWYNDGTYGADNDWSHVVLGIATDFEVMENLSFTPGFYFQKSMNNSVNAFDEQWVSLNMSYNF